MAGWHLADSDKCFFFSFLFQDEPVFYSWKAKRVWDLTINLRTLKINYRRIYSLWHTREVTDQALLGARSSVRARRSNAAYLLGRGNSPTIPQRPCEKIPVWRGNLSRYAGWSRACQRKTLKPKGVRRYSPPGSTGHHRP
jgi:hypothetical protein